MVALLLVFLNDKYYKLKRLCLFIATYLPFVFQGDIAEKYAVILDTFGQEIEEIKKLYQKCREDPPIPRDMAPISGKIMWSRQLFRKIQEPMEVFQEFASGLLKVLL